MFTNLIYSLAMEAIDVLMSTSDMRVSHGLREYPTRDRRTVHSGRPARNILSA